MSDALVRHVVASAGCCARPGSRSGPGGSPTRCEGLDAVDSTRQDDVYWTLRQTLVSRREELEPFDRAFDAWFLRGARAAGCARRAASRRPAPLQRTARGRAGRRGRARGGEARGRLERATRSSGAKDFADDDARASSRGAGADRGARGRRGRGAARGGCGAHPRGHVARPARARARVARDRRRPDRPRFRRRVDVPRKLVAALRRLGLDGAVLARAPALRPRAPSDRAAASRRSSSARG